MRFSITYQSRKLCLQENVNGKSTELKTGGSVNDLNLRTVFLKKYPFSTTSPHGEKEIHTLLFALLYRVEVPCICIFGMLQHTVQNLFEGGQGLARDGLRLLPCTAGIDKGKSSRYITQMHCKCVLLASLTLTGKTIRETNAD